MNIAFISGVFFPVPGGAQVQIHNVANKLCKLGCDVGDPDGCIVGVCNGCCVG